MSCFILVLYSFLVLAISMFILAFGNTEGYKKLKGNCQTCSSKDPCYAFICSTLTDKCKVLPREIDVLNEYLRRVSDLVYVTREMYKCYMPTIQSLRCQIMANAEEVLPLLPNRSDMAISRPTGDNYGLMSSDDLPGSTSSHCSLSGETETSCMECPGNPTCCASYDESAQQTALIEQAVRFLYDCMKHEC